ncbi:hypothetical protein HDG32_005388 [Paraburkholderia sp. CI2]|nr:hypothetical protein [Paraburkholderia sp. CI2]
MASADGNDELDITLDIVADDIEPYALLTALDTFGEQLAQVQVAPSFKLSKASAVAWVENEFRRPGWRRGRPADQADSKITKACQYTFILTS